MTVTLHATEKIVELQGAEEHPPIKARIWEGQTDTGIKVFALISRIAIDANSPQHVIDQFNAELMETRPPSASIQSFPNRIIL